MPCFAQLAGFASLLCLAACGPASAPSSSGGQTSTGPAPASTPAPLAPAAPTPEQIAAALAALPAPYNTGDVDNGHAKFALCMACHTAVAALSDSDSLEPQLPRKAREAAYDRWLEAIGRIRSG